MAKNTGTRTDPALRERLEEEILQAGERFVPDPEAAPKARERAQGDA